MGDLVVPALSREIQQARPGQAAISLLHVSILEGVKRGLLSEITEELEHLHADGLYCRVCHVPAGCVLVSRVHLSQHITIALAGTATVYTHDGSRKKVTAPGVFVTEKGTHRAVYCHTDVTWVTVHATDKTDIDEIEEELYRMEFSEGDPRIMALIGGQKWQQ